MEQARTQAMRIVEQARRESQAFLMELEKLKKEKEKNQNLADLARRAKSQMKQHANAMAEVTNPVVAPVIDDADYVLPRPLQVGDAVLIADLDKQATVLTLPDKNGNVEDIVLGFDNVAGYEVNGCFFGAFIGRHGNRIGDAKFELDGVTYELEKNDGKNNLHGGTPGYHQVMYQAAVGDNSVTFTRVSPDGEQGYPGNLDVSLTYTLTDDNELKLHYVTKSDKNTLCNLTNHSYFNLKGHKSGQITDHIVTIKANGFTSTSDDLIPDGTIVDVTDTPMDFRKPRCVGDDIDSDYPPIVLAGGYDHNYVLDKPEGTFAKVAEVTEKESGRTMEVYTDLPGMQLYSGNFIENEKGKDGQTYTKRTGICFETQFFPNSINVKSFTPCVIKAGETFESETMYKFIF